MNYQKDKQTPRWRALSLLLVSCALLAAAMPAPQEDDDVTRRLWNKQFLSLRAWPGFLGQARRLRKRRRSRRQAPGRGPNPARPAVKLWMAS